MSATDIAMSQSSSPPGNVDQRILDAVKQYWGYDALRPLQSQAIHASLAARDSLVVLPTGGGKSLCYQVPPVVADRTDVVVSPLISLMKDQVDGLEACGYPAVALNSGMSIEDRRRAFRSAMDGKVRLIFVAPERLMMESFLDSVSQLSVRSFAIDEAHCISHWGHDFRPEYRRLAELKRRFPYASIHAYTATATERVRADIIQQLGLARPEVLVGNFDRPNLTYRVIPRTDVHAQTVEIIGRHADEAVIVYCISRRDTEEMATHLNQKGIKAVYYHAGMSPDARRRAQEKFSREEINVVVATVAFGMGIDRGNVRCVIHAAMPKSIEHYQQETGRAGRDGLEAECVMLYSPGDPVKWQRILSSADDSDDFKANFRAQVELLQHLQSYCQPFDCRHRRLVEYFGQSYERATCEACDFCLDETGDLTDVTVEAQKILSCIARTGEKFGPKHIADVLKGGDTEMIRKWKHASLSTYGLLREMPKRELVALIGRLADLGMMNRTTDGFGTLQLNPASWEVMRGERKVKLPSATEAGRSEPARDVSWVGVDRGLFELLRRKRKEIADDRSVPPYVIFSDASLRDMARRRPQSESSFKVIHGVGASKAEEFGRDFIQCIRTYCESHRLSEDLNAAPTAPLNRRPNRPTGAALQAYEMFRRGATIDQVVDESNRARSTVVAYLSNFIEEESPESIEPWVARSVYERVSAAAGVLGTQRLKPVFEAMNGSVSYDDIRLVITHLNAAGGAVDTAPPETPGA